MKKLFDIFSKTKERKKDSKKVKIIIDYRERNSLVASELINLGLEIEFKELKVADYIVNETAIERKTVFDFISSMLNKRLFRQLEELQQYPNRILIIEGITENELYDDKREWGVKANAIRGFLLSIITSYKTPVLFTKNQEDTSKFIYILSQKKSKEMSLNAKKRYLTDKQQMQYILEGFQGIGPKTAQKLLEKFKTLKNIFNASEEELKELIGKKAEAFKLLHKEYQES